MHPSLTQLGDEPAKTPVGDRTRHELSYWFGNQLFSSPAKFSDLRPLPKLAVLGLVVTAPYHFMTWAVADIPYYMRRDREDLYSRVQNSEVERAVNYEAFRLHESVVVGNNPLAWLYEAAPITATATIFGSLGFHAFAVKPLARKLLGPNRSLLLADVAIAGYCLAQTSFCRTMSLNAPPYAWVKLARGQTRE